MCSGVKGVFDAVSSFISKVWNAVKKYLVYIIIIAAIFYPFLIVYLQTTLGPTLYAALTEAAVGTVWASATAGGWYGFVIRAIVGFAIGYLVDEETTDEVVAAVTEAAKNTAEAVTGVLVGVTGGVVSGLFSSPWVVLGAGALLWWMFGKSKDEDTERKSASPATSPGEKETPDSDSTPAKEVTDGKEPIAAGA